MKYLLVVVFLLGFACASEEEEVSLQDISDMSFMDDLMSTDTELGRQANNQIQLLIGNLVAGLNALNGTTDIGSLINSILAPILGVTGTTAALGGIAAPVLGVKAVISAIIGGLANAGTGLIGIANSILALVGLVFLIIFLIDGGDFGSLLGVARSSSVLPEFDFDLVNNPVVESISQMFFSAMEKYA